jgi:hypothetical protein
LTALILLIWGVSRAYLNIMWFYGLSKTTLNAVQQYQQTIIVTQTRKLELDKCDTEEKIPENNQENSAQENQIKKKK